VFDLYRTFYLYRTCAGFAALPSRTSDELMASCSFMTSLTSGLSSTFVIGWKLSRSASNLRRPLHPRLHMAEMLSPASNWPIASQYSVLVSHCVTAKFCACVGSPSGSEFKKILSG